VAEQLKKKVGAQDVPMDIGDKVKAPTFIAP